MPSRVLLPLLALALVLGTPGAAPAALRFRACSDVVAARCATLRVPLDRSGALRGTVGLRVARFRGTGPRTLVYLSGGPGGAGVEELAGLRGVLRVPGYRLVGFDQRGTGRSGLLRCPELERDPRLRSTLAGERCARRLGARRGHYTTEATVEDLEALRVALGVARLTLVGVSYGTEVGLAYARAHPDRVERLVLDSVVDPASKDPYALESWRAMGPALRAICPGGCRGVSPDPVADLSALAARLRARPLRAYATPGGRRWTLSAVALSDLMFDSDYAPELRAALPAAVASLNRHGHRAPLARLLALAAPLAALPGPREFSAARYATLCESAPLPWTPGTPIEERLAVAEAGAAALGPDAFGPFAFTEARADVVDLCLRWPDRAVPAAPRLAPYPAVPALVVQGEQDLRTPPAVSARVAAALPGARVLSVPGVGHAPLAADPTGCAPRAVRRFLRGAVGGAARCASAPAVPAAPVLPARVEQLDGARTVAGRTARAVALTLADAAWAAGLGLGAAEAEPGLHGGRLRVRGGRLALAGFAAVPGVLVSGTPGRLRVRGARAAGGTVRVARGRLTGRLGGRRVSVRVEAGARARAAGRRSAAPAPPSRLGGAVRSGARPRG